MEIKIAGNCTDSTPTTTLIVREHPLAKPDHFNVPSGFSISELQAELPERESLKPTVVVNGEAADPQYIVKPTDIVEVDFVPQADPFTTMALYAVLGMAAGYLGARLFKPSIGQQDADSTFARIKSLRNSERLYETQPLILGKRKVAPHFISRPYTLIEGGSEYYYALLSAGYGPLKLENFNIGGTPLEEFEHEIAVLDHYERKSIADVHKLYSADISQESVDVDLKLIEGETPTWTNRASAADPEEIVVELSFPAGLSRTNPKGKKRFTEVGIDLEMQDTNGDWLRVFPNIRAYYYDTIFPIVFKVSKGELFTIDAVANPLNPEIRVATQNIESTNLTTIASQSTVVNNITKKGRHYTGKTYRTALNFEKPIFVYSAVAEAPTGINTYSLFKVASTTKQFMESLHFAPQQEGKVNIRVRKSYALFQDSTSDGPVTDLVKLDNIKTKRALPYNDFLVAIGGNRPHLRYIDADDNNKVVQTFRPTVIALRIRATGQFNGALDNFFCDATMVVPQDKTADWRDWPSLPLHPSTSPADAYKWLLQGPANYSPVAIEKIDHSTLQTWRHHCAIEGWTVSANINYESTLLPELQNVAYVGRAEWAFTDGKFGVVEKIEKTLPVQMFTPRNSRGFQSTRNYPEDVDGIKFEFESADFDYEKDEGTFLEPAKTADPSLLRGRFRRQTLWGVDNYEQAYRLTRFAYYEEALQREVYTLTTDVESLRCKRGDLVYIQADTIDVGLGSGRVTKVIGKQVWLDDHNGVEEGEGEQLGLVARTSDGFIEFYDATYQEDGKWLLEDTPVGVEKGDLITYGVKGSEVLECIVKEVQYGAEMTCDLTLVNAANEIFNYDGNPIPEYTSTLKPPVDTATPLAPTLLETVSLDAETNTVGLSLTATDPARGQGLFYKVEFRPFESETTRLAPNSEEGWQVAASVISEELNFVVTRLLVGLHYEFRVQARRNTTHVSPWSNVVSVYNRGVDAPPAPIRMELVTSDWEIRCSPVSSADIYNVTYEYSLDGAEVLARGSTHTFTGLLPNTEYVVYARAVNEGGHSSWISDTATTTEAGTQVDPFLDDLSIRIQNAQNELDSLEEISVSVPNINDLVAQVVVDVNEIFDRRADVDQESHKRIQEFERIEVELETGLTATNTRVSEVEVEVGGNASAIEALELTVNNPTSGLAATISRVDAVSVLANGNAGAISALDTRVENNEGFASSQLILNSGYSADINEFYARAWLGTDVNNRVTGISINGGAQQTITFLGNAAQFARPDGTVMVKFDTIKQKFLFNGELIAAGGTFTGTLDGVDGNFKGTLDANVVVSDNIQAGDITATMLKADAIYGKRQVLTAGGISWVTDPADEELPSDIMVWAGDENLSPAQRTRETGVFWIDTDGAYSSPVNQTVDFALTDTNVIKTLAHKSIRGGCRITANIDTLLGPVNNVSSINGSNHRMVVRIKRGGVLLGTRTVPITLTGSPPSLVTASTEAFSFEVLDDNTGLAYFTQRNYTLELTVILDVAYTQPNYTPTLTGQGAFTSLEIRQL